MWPVRNAATLLQDGCLQETSHDIWSAHIVTMDLNLQTTKLAMDLLPMTTKQTAGEFLTYRSETLYDRLQLYKKQKRWIGVWPS
jgi:hypothetical protein